MKILQPAPDKLCDNNGKPLLGMYRGEYPAIAQLENLAPDLQGIVNRSIRKKEWVWLGVFSPEVIAAFLVADAGYVGEVFGYVISHKSGKNIDPTQITWTAPAGIGCNIKGPLSDLSARARTLTRRVDIVTKGEGFIVEVEAPPIEGRFSLINKGTPISVLSNLGADGFLGGTMKAGSLLATGEFSIEEPEGGKRKVRFSEVPAGLDWSCGFFPYITRWHWGFAVGEDSEERSVGFNLCRGVHDDPLRDITENALWIKGKPEALPQLHFEPIEEKPGHWRIATLTKREKVELEFRPITQRRNEVDYGIVSSRLKQAYGTYHGVLRDAAGRTCKVDGLIGVLEEHHAQW